MFSRMMTNGFTKGFSDKPEDLRKAIDEADAVIIGAGAGLSTAAGFDYSGEAFNTYFSDFAKKYRIRDMYSGGFFPFPTQQEKWAWWSRHIWINRYVKAPEPVYDNLLKAVKDKDYFVITTNVDHQFQFAGFEKERLFYTQGDYGLWQCSKPCHNKTYDNYEQVREMVLAQGFEIEEGTDRLLIPENTEIKMKVPAEMVPRCPVCGRPMEMNLRCDNSFVEDDGWHAASERYEKFIGSHHVNDKILFIEIGVGMNTPVIIKYPFWRMVSQLPNSTYACLNKGEAYAPQEISDKSICIDDDFNNVLSQIN